MADSSATAGYTPAKASRGSSDRSGESGSGDVTAQPGQYPPGSDHGIFGGTLPTGTGAPGSGGGAGGGDPTTEPGQTGDYFTGTPEAQLTSTGAPGTSGGQGSDGGGPDAVSFTRAGSYLSGTYAQDSVRDEIGGPGNWTEANDSGYATGGPQLPGIKGNEPQAGEGRFQPGGGQVLHGGRYHG